MTATLVIGGARSGKSGYALTRVEAHAGPLAFIATAEAHDAEMADRIARHQGERGARWACHEAALDLPAAIGRAQASAAAILVDCLTLWLSNLMAAERDLATEIAALESAIAACPVPLVLVTNEVGQGIVPMNALARRFRDEAGWLNQRVARIAGEVVLVTAGLALKLKEPLSA